MQRRTRAIQILLVAGSQKLGGLLDQASQRTASQRHETRISDQCSGGKSLEAILKEQNGSSSSLKLVRGCARYTISKHQLSLVGVTLTSGLLRLAKALAHNECRFRATENASGNTWNISRDGTSHGGKCKTMSRYLVTNLMPGRLKLTPNITACLATQTTVFSCES